MTKQRLITKSSTKRITAAALTEAKARNGWSNADLGDGMDCSEGCARLRMDGDDPKNQMTVHELRRITQSDGPAVANLIFADLHYRLDGGVAELPTEILHVSASLARLAAAISSAAAGGPLNAVDARALLPDAVEVSRQIHGLKALLRALSEGGQATG